MVTIAISTAKPRQKMKISITFLGAARNVTGSRYLVEANGRRLLVDCGLYQERDFKDRNWDPFPFPPERIDTVLLTHAHLDHCGLLPKLYKEGFNGKILCTPATIEIAKIVLMDSAKLQEEDAAFKKRRHQREGRKGRHPEASLYTKEDAEQCCSCFSSIDYEREVELGNGIQVTYYEAGHILGSTMIKLCINQDGEQRNIIFSGDIGRENAPILRDPTRFEKADYIVMESTYGDKSVTISADIHETLSEIINETKARGGNIVIPSFAIERSQEVLYRLSELLRQDRIPHMMVFVDSPMAIRVTEVFRHHPELFDAEAVELLNSGKHLCDFPGLQMCRTSHESKAINQIRGSVIIIAGSGMCTGGRVKHHLVNNIARPESTILFVGYQAVGTLGRQIVDGAEMVRVLGKQYPVKARVVKIDGFSAHADREELFEWLSAFRQHPPQRTFLVHGEERASKSFAQLVKDKLGFKTERPCYKDKFNLD